MSSISPSLLDFYSRALPSLVERVRSSSVSHTSLFSARASPLAPVKSDGLLFLDALVHALFSVAPLREAVFSWRPDADGADSPSSGASAVIHALQELFARRAMSVSRTAGGADALLDALGWEAEAAVGAHDARGVVAALFGALDAARVGGDGFVSSIFGGGWGLAGDEAFLTLDVNPSTGLPGAETVEPLPSSEQLPATPVSFLHTALLTVARGRVLSPPQYALLRIPRFAPAPDGPAHVLVRNDSPSDFPTSFSLGGLMAQADDVLARALAGDAVPEAEPSHALLAAIVHSPSAGYSVLLGDELNAASPHGPVSWRFITADGEDAPADSREVDAIIAGVTRTSAVGRVAAGTLPTLLLYGPSRRDATSVASPRPPLLIPSDDEAFVGAHADARAQQWWRRHEDARNLALGKCGAGVGGFVPLPPSFGAAQSAARLAAQYDTAAQTGAGVLPPALLSRLHAENSGELSLGVTAALSDAVTAVTLVLPPPGTIPKGTAALSPRALAFSPAEDKQTTLYLPKSASAWGVVNALHGALVTAWGEGGRLAGGGGQAVPPALRDVRIRVWDSDARVALASIPHAARTVLADIALAANGDSGRVTLALEIRPRTTLPISLDESEPPAPEHVDEWVPWAYDIPAGA